ncbi:MAG: homoserine dehydrogenase [Myxococcota bacterium]
MADAVRVALIGFGTIGRGVVRLLHEQQTSLDRRLGFPLRLTRIADIDLESDRGVPLEGIALTRDWREAAGADDVDLVIELVGGTGIAREIVCETLRSGRGVVTANKALLAHFGPELYEAARAAGADLAFEASVGGTIPVLRALREGLCADRLRSVVGIVNGTCNYVLSEMREAGESYASALKRAQDLGFAEADPSFDVDGSDSMHKLAILVGLAFGAHLGPNDIATRGIQALQPVDLEFASRFGLRIKLLALAKLREGTLEARVEPMMIPEQSLLAGVGGAMNAIEISGEFSGPTLYYGAGAGSLPTASAVVSDLMELARALRLGAQGRVSPLGCPSLRSLPLRSPADGVSEFYLRFTVADRPNVLAGITGALGAQGISIASVVQPERHESGATPVVLMTHEAKEPGVRAALAQIDRMGDATAPTQVIRIEREIAGA